MKYKGGLKDFPSEVVNKMLDRQEEQGNRRNVGVFEIDPKAFGYGFRWAETIEGFVFWDYVIVGGNFDIFFEKYPKEVREDPIRLPDRYHGLSDLATEIHDNAKK